MFDTTIIPAWIMRRWRLVAGVLAVALATVMIALVGLVHYQRNVDQETRQAVVRSYVLRAHMQRLFLLVLDVETSGRGFGITGQDIYLVPYDRARTEIPDELAQLRASALDPPDRAHMSRLEALVRRKLEITEHNIARRRSGHKQTAGSMTRAAVTQQIIMHTAEAREVMDQLRVELAGWSSEEEGELAQRLAEADAAEAALRFTLRCLAAGVVVILMAGGWCAVAFAKSRDQAEAANQAKSAFLAMMSHELRTPLNGVLGMAHALAASRLEPRQQGYVEVIESSGQSLLAILNDILDLSKIEAGRLEIEAIPYSLPELLDAIVALWNGPAVEKGLRLVVELEDLPQWVNGDPTRLRQVLTNLLSNALKFTNHGEIRFRVRYGDGQRIQFQVADTGSGMSPAVQARLFRDFSQGDVSTGRKFGGTGLGLSISRRLCRMMGGDLEVQSVEGEGSTFTGAIVAPAAQPPAGAVEAEGQEDLPTLRILAVDDNAANRAVIEALLHALGLPVILACDGAEALEVLRAAPVDLVLMDVNMPVMDGLEALAAIREGKAGDPQIRVVALTADAMAGDRERFLAKGFDGHLSKPIVPQALIEALAEAVQGVRPADAAASGRAAA